MEKMEAAIIKMVRDYLRQFDEKPRLFDDEDKLIFSTNADAKESKGVYIIDAAFGRGIDFKFKKNAFVIVILNDDI